MFLDIHSSILKLLEKQEELEQRILSLIDEMNQLINLEKPKEENNE